MNHGSVYRIVSDHLKLKKITACYVPNHLINTQRAEQVRICKETLAKFERGTWSRGVALLITSNK